MKALGIDIGGTKICYGIIDENGEILGEVNKISTPNTLDDIKNTLKKIISENEDNVDSIAIATAGAVNRENSQVISSTGNLPKGYNTIKFKELSTKKVFVENDANAAAWAEYKIGSAQGHENTITVTLGTGIGSGIIVDGKLLRGKSGAAGEMHFKMYPDKRRKCTCGCYDCWEAYGSGTALTVTAREMLEDENITSYDIIEGVKNNDEKSRLVFMRWQNDILVGLIGLANIFDPDSIVLSGSMADFVNYEILQEAVNSEIVTTPTKILHAKMKNNAGMIGAALLSFENN